MLAAAALAPSCSFPLIHKKKVTPAVPIPPLVAAPLPPPKPRPVSMPGPPEVAADEPDLNQPGLDLPEEPLPPAPRRRIKPRPREEADSPAPVPTETPTAPAPLPQFEQVLTPEQRQAYTEEIERNIANAQRAVTALEGRRLTGEQSTYLARVRTFIDQATEARKGDLFRARNLAERASVLAEDLLKSVQ